MEKTIVPNRIDVTKTFLPPLEEFQAYLREIWERGQVTNQGPLLLAFEQATEEYLRINNMHFVSSGTIALQLAIKALDLPGGDIITTPFSYVATTSAILWERYRPVFVDIDPLDFCIDASKIEASITPDTRAILAVHVFGNPCKIETIEKIAAKHSLKVIYDAAHCFAVKYRGKSLLNFGDISTCSFHATKVFNTIEGGCLVVKNQELSNKVELLKRFGHNGDDHYMLGINAKASEFQAAMGLCNLKYIENLIEKRKAVANLYDSLISDNLKKPLKHKDAESNYGYYPIVFSDERDLLRAVSSLAKKNIFPRRYFFPSLNRLPYLNERGRCPVAESISSRILCLPIYPDLSSEVVTIISEFINNVQN